MRVKVKELVVLTPIPGISNGDSYNRWTPPNVEGTIRDGCLFIPTSSGEYRMLPLTTISYGTIEPINDDERGPATKAENRKGKTANKASTG